jgi:hypothetical protein
MTECTGSWRDPPGLAPGLLDGYKIDLSCPHNRANQRQGLFNDVPRWNRESSCDWLEGLATTFTECGDRFDARSNAATKAGHDRQTCGRGRCSCTRTALAQVLRGREHRRRQTFRRHGSVALEPWPSFSAPSLAGPYFKDAGGKPSPSAQRQRAHSLGRSISKALPGSYQHRRDGNQELALSGSRLPFHFQSRSAGTGTRP